ncbi:unnamed protein product [Paramecium primaurelia]|uniref:Uncharacterized protein n=1 Tax=Paramecium primaurelia TaxID=5886 RepID=A0A8S1L538_PARPR|nr:unnamed protein product [Paramecium primaurelia]
MEHELIWYYIDKSQQEPEKQSKGPLSIRDIDLMIKNQHYYITQLMILIFDTYVFMVQRKVAFIYGQRSKKMFYLRMMDYNKMMNRECKFQIRNHKKTNQRKKLKILILQIYIVLLKHKIKNLQSRSSINIFVKVRVFKDHSQAKVKFSSTYDAELCFTNINGVEFNNNFNVSIENNEVEEQYLVNGQKNRGIVIRIKGKISINECMIIEIYLFNSQIFQQFDFEQGMNRENAIQYRSPQQIPSSKKPNMENLQPHRNTNEFIKQMKKRVDQPPLSVVSQNSQIQDAQSIFIDVSRIEQQSNNSNNSFLDPLKQPILPQCHRSNQPSNCTTQRTNRYEMQRNSKPYLDQTDNMGLLMIQQQMLQLQNENMILKQQLEKQESQRLLFQQQLLQQFQSQQQQQQQQPIVINNNITQSEKQQQQQSKSIPPQKDQEESESPPKKIQRKKQQSQAIQTDKSVQDQSIININESYHNQSQCNKSKQILQQQQIKSHQQQKQSMESLTFGTQLSQRNLISQQSQQELQIQNTDNQSKNQSYQQINTNSIEFQMDNQQKDVQIQNKSDVQRKYSQIDITNSSIQQDKTYSIHNPEIRKQSQPSVKLEFNFEEGTNESSKKCLADYFSQRKKTANVERRVSVQMPIQEEDQSWIVNVKQRSKEEQIKLRKEMMEYGRSKRSQNKSQTPINDDKNSGQKEQVKRVQSPLMERLAMGQKAKVEEKEMFALTKKNYENLPEVKSKKNQEEVIKQKQLFMKERQNKLKELDDKIKEKMKKA